MIEIMINPVIVTTVVGWFVLAVALEMFEEAGVELFEYNNDGLILRK